MNRTRWRSEIRHSLPRRAWIRREILEAIDTPVLKNGNVLYIIHQVDDVTERVRTKAKLESQTEILKRNKRGT
jgi:hypothetical protein